MQLTNILAAIAMLAMSAAPVLAAPEAIPELDTRAQCIGGHNLIGSGCAPRFRDKTSCSANDRAVVSNPLSPSPLPGGQYAFGGVMSYLLRLLHRLFARALGQLGTFRMNASVAPAITTACAHRLLLRLGWMKVQASGSISARINS